MVEKIGHRGLRTTQVPTRSSCLRQGKSSTPTHGSLGRSCGNEGTRRPHRVAGPGGVSGLERVRFPMGLRLTQCRRSPRATQAQEGQGDLRALPRTPGLSRVRLELRARRQDEARHGAVPLARSESCSRDHCTVVSNSLRPTTCRSLTPIVAPRRREFVVESRGRTRLSPEFPT